MKRTQYTHMFNLTSLIRHRLNCDDVDVEMKSNETVFKHFRTYVVIDL